MPRFSANLSMLYTEHGFLDRFRAAADDGFKAVEYIGPYEESPDMVARALNAGGLTQALFNLPTGDWAGGERGIASLPGRQDEFRAGVTKAVTYAKALNCTQVNCLAGIVPEGAEAAHEDVLIENLKYASDTLAQADIRLLVEPINTRDIPGFALSTTDQWERIASRVNAPNLWLQYDFYHMQIMQGDLIPTFLRLQSRIAHVQIADTPGRHEPGTGEIDHSFLFKSLDAAGYSGWVGCEYKPLADTTEGLGWMEQMTGAVA